jgi:hypothetical protein
MDQAIRTELKKQTRQAARAMRDLSNTYRTKNAAASKLFPATQPVFPATQPIFELPVTYSSSDTDSDAHDGRDVEVILKTVKKTKKRRTSSTSSTKTKKRRVSTTPTKKSATTPIVAKKRLTPTTPKRSTTPMKRSVKFAETPIKKYTYPATTPMKRSVNFAENPAQTQAPADTDTDDDTDDDVIEVPTPVKRTPALKATRTVPPRTPVELRLTCDIRLGPFALATIAARVEEIFLRKMMNTLDQED